MARRQKLMRRIVCIGCIVWGLFVYPALAETRIQGRIRGKVIDEETQNPLVAVNILIMGTQMGTASDENGEYEIKNVPSGIYQLQFMMMGYKDRIIGDVVINPNKTTWQKIELTPSVLETQGVTVTAGFFHAAKDAVVSNRSVDFEEIRMDPGSAMDIQRVVQVLPAVVSGSDQMNEIIVRGGIPGENLFVMDQIEIPNPNHFGEQGTGGGPINMINANMVRRVDFYAGAFPARYGDKASSVMDISLREGNREKITGHAFLGMSGAGGIIEGPIAGGKGSYILSGQKSFLDLIISSIGLTAVPKYYSLQGKMIYHPRPSDQIIINGIYGNDRIRIEDTEDSYSQGAENVLALSHQYATGTTWQHLFGEKGFSRVTLSQVSNHWNTDVYRDNGVRYYKKESTETEQTLKADINWQYNKILEWSAGGHVKKIPFDIYQWVEKDTLSVFDWPEHPTLFLRDSLYYDEFLQKVDQSTMKATGFFQAKWQLWPRLSTSLGLRLDYFDYTRKSALDPRLGFSYAMTPFSSINFALGQHSQAPAYIEATLNPLNKDLDYKKTQQIVLGLEHLFREDIRSTLEIFYKDYKDVPIGISSLTPDPYDESDGRLVNEGRGFAKGIEFFLQKKRVDHIHYTLSYSYSQSKGFDPRYNKTYNWDYDYRHVFTFVSGLLFDCREYDWYQKLKKNWLFNFFAWALPVADQLEIGIRWRYLGGRPYTERTYLPRYRVWKTLPITPYNTLRYPEYHRFDLRIDRRYMFKTWNMVTFFDIMNIYGRDNIWSYSYNSDGTKEEILQWQVFPVGGISIEF